MRSLYWKIFLSFWLATILIILSIAWITSEIARKSSIPAHEKVFMDSYANAAVALFESGHQTALKKWLEKIGTPKEMSLYLLCSTGEIIGHVNTPPAVKLISTDLIRGNLDDGLLKFNNIVVSHEILSTSSKAYRLVAVSEKPLAHFVEIPWASISLRLITAIFISGFICYFLSIYLTRPLSSLSLAAQSIAMGKLNTRVGHFRGHRHDEIAKLSQEFNLMAEHLEAIINSKERLLQDISHELRSPLARLQIAIELGRKKALPLATTEFSRMEIECLRLNTLISEILEFARLDKSIMQLNKKLISLSDLITQVIEDAYFEFKTMKPKLVFNCPKDIKLAMDERLIHRALENILRNALHYSAPHPKITISLEQNEQDKKIHIIIEDNGPGVPEEQLTKIFNPFYRVDYSREKKTGGYGLGLAIAQQAIKAHQGTIQATNKHRRGLLIKITLPEKDN